MEERLKHLEQSKTDADNSAQALASESEALRAEEQQLAELESTLEPEYTCGIYRTHKIHPQQTRGGDANVIARLRRAT